MKINNPAELITFLKHALIRHKLAILLCIIGVMIPILYYNHTTTPVYEASVTVIFNDGTNPLDNTLDPMRRFYRETSILNHIEEIKSHALAEVIKENLSDSILARIELPDPPPPHFDKDRYLTNVIKGSISASVIRNTDVIQISADTPDRFLSMIIANTAAEVLQESGHLDKQNEATGVRDFIEQQLQFYHKQLNNAEQKLRRYKETHKITSLENESTEILKRITDCEVSYNQARTQRSATEEKLNAIRKRLNAHQADLANKISNVSSPILQSLQERLAELQEQYARLQVQHYKGTHPKMVGLNKEIEQTKKSIRDEVLKLTPKDFELDPLKQINSYLTEILTMEIELESYKAQEKACRSLLNEYEDALKDLPAKEFELANLMREKTVNEKIYIDLMQKREEARISAAEEFASCRIIDSAQLPTKPAKPNKKLNLALGLVMGSILGLGLAFLLETMNSSLRTSEDVESLTSWPVLATIPQMDLAALDKKDNLAEDLKIEVPQDPYARGGMYSYFYPKSIVAEAYRVLRTNMQFHHESHKIKAILLSSVSASEGKSTSTANLGITLTKLGLKVLIIDADLRRPAMHKLFGLDNEPGLADVLKNHHTIINDLAAEERERSFNDKVDDSPVWSTIQNLKGHNKDVNALEENLQDFSVETQKAQEKNTPASPYINFLNVSLIESIQTTPVPGLKVLTSGKNLPNPSEILSTESMAWLLNLLRQKYDIILIDSPPLLLVPDSMIITKLVDGVIFVIESGKNEEKMLKKAQQFLDKTKTNVLGAILNRVDPKIMYKDKDYYYFG